MKIQAFDYSVDLLQTILWQYNDAKSLTTLIKKKQDWYTENQQKYWENWYTDVFNLLTANDFGLAVWSLILGLPLFVNPNPDPPGKLIWGFGTASNSYKNYNRGVFSTYVSGPLVLDKTQKRLILRLRYFQLTTRCDILDINRFLKLVFNEAGLGTVYMLDTLKMEIRYVFSQRPPRNVLAVLKLYDLLPRGAGVGIRYIDATRNTFGFGQNYKNYGNGTFNRDL
jgi:hypothetical protein